MSAVIKSFPITDRARLRLHRRRMQAFRLRVPTLLTLAIALRQHQVDHPHIWQTNLFWIQHGSSARLANTTVDSAYAVALMGEEADPRRVVLYLELCHNLLLWLNRGSSTGGPKCA